jgi:hypothetical protein
MRTFLFAAFLCLALNVNGLAEQPADARSPAQEDLKAQIARTRQDLQQTLDSLSNQLRQNMRGFQKGRERLPADFEARINAMAEDLKNTIRTDELTRAITTIYRKHFSKEDLRAITDLHSNAAREKILRDMPAIAEETKQSVAPILRRQMVEMNQELRKDMSELRKQLQTKPDQK